MGTVVASPSHALRRGDCGGRKLDAPTGTSRAGLCFGCFNWLALGLFRHWRSPFSFLQRASAALRAMSRRRAGVILTMRAFVAFRSVTFTDFYADLFNAGDLSAADDLVSVDRILHDAPPGPARLPEPALRPPVPGPPALPRGRAWDDWYSRRS